MTKHREITIIDPAPESSASVMRIEYMPLSDLIGRRFEGNAKDHDEGAIALSMNRFGFASPILLEESSGKIAAGHGRIDTLADLRAQGRQPPARVEVREDDWYIPVIRGLSFASALELEAYLLADNQTTILGGWHEDKLLAALQRLSGEDEQLFNATGFDADDMRALMLNVNGNGSGGDAPEPKLEHIKEVHAKWRASSGDLWLIPSQSGTGTHRLVCGDSTDPNVVALALGDLAPNLMATDPPYGVNYDPQWRADYDLERGHSPHHSLGKVLNDDIVDWSPALKLFPGNVMYVWHAGIYGPEVGMGIKGCGFVIRAQLIWRKSVMVFGRGDYHWQHEPMYYAVRKGHKSNWNGDRTQTTVWDIPNMSSAAHNKDSEDQPTGHGTQKPLLGYKRPIENHTVPGEAVYDPFQGAGTLICACELTGRIGIGIELDPEYVSLSLERFSDMGLIPERAERAEIVVADP